MRIDDMILVSIDDHVIEPRDMFERHVPDKYKDDAPKVVKNDNGRRAVALPGQVRRFDGLERRRHVAEGRLGDGSRELRRDASRARTTCTSASAT